VIDDNIYTVVVGASPSLGDENAANVVMIFSDFECSYCGQFANEQFPAIKEEYIDSGKVRFVFKQFPLSTHRSARLASQAALCADDQDNFWEYHDLLYKNQGALGQTDLLEHAQTIGLDIQHFSDCMNDGESRLDAEIAQGKNLGVTGTPTFFFNGKKVVGAIDFSTFSEWVDERD
jgi:protein-disulfide isomerase